MGLKVQILIQYLHLMRQMKSQAKCSKMAIQNSSQNLISSQKSSFCDRSLKELGEDLRAVWLNAQYQF